MSSQGAGQPAERPSGKCLTALVRVSGAIKKNFQIHPPFLVSIHNWRHAALSQNIKVELESVQEELTTTRKDKFMLQVKVSELRNSMKTVLLQNQQLKLDLKQNRLRKVRR